MSRRIPPSRAIADVERRVAATPFVPFMLLTSSGQSYNVPSPINVTVTTLLREVRIEYADGTGAIIQPEHIAAIEPLREGSSP
jgi:hypothetical protein